MTSPKPMLRGSKDFQIQLKDLKTSRFSKSRSRILADDEDEEAIVEQSTRLLTSDTSEPNNTDINGQDNTEAEEKDDNGEATITKQMKTPLSQRIKDHPYRKKLKSYFESREFKHTFKTTIAFVIASLFTFIDPVGDVLGKANFFVAMTITLGDVAMSMGAIVDRFLCFVAAITYACIMTTITLYTSINRGSGILAFFFAVTFSFTWARAKFPNRWTTPIIISQEVFLLTVVTGVRSGRFDITMIIANFINIFIGAMISLTVAALLFPFSANQVLLKEVSSTFKNIRSVLELNTKAFLMDASEKELKDLLSYQSRIKGNFSKLTATVREAKMEFARSYFTNQQIQKMVFLIRTLLQHINAMISCYSKDSMSSIRDKREIFHDQMMHLSPSLMNITNKCIETVEVLTHYFDETDSKMKRNKFTETFRELINELEMNLSELKETRSKVMESIMPASTPSLLTSSQSEMDLNGNPLTLSNEEVHVASNGAWDGIYRAYFFVFTYQKFVSDLEKVIAFLKRTNSNKKMLQLPSWMTHGKKSHTVTVGANWGKSENSLNSSGNISRSNLEDASLTKELIPKRNVDNDSSDMSNGSDGNGVSSSDNSVVSSPSSRRSPISTKSPSTRKFNLGASLTFQRGSLERVLQEEDEATEQENNPIARLAKLVPEEVRQLKPGNKEDLGHISIQEDTNTLGYKIWRLSTMFSNSNAVLFAFKTALSICMITLPFVLNDTKDFWNAWRGEWALFTIAAIASPNVGANAINAFWRLTGTAVGALWAVIAWMSFPDNPYGLVFMSGIFAFASFHIKLHTKYPRLGVVSLSTYIIILMGKFALIHTATTPVNSDHIAILAMKRAACIATGVITVMLFSRFVFPSLARKDMRRQMSKALHHFSDLYSAITAIFMLEKVEGKQSKEINTLAQKIQMELIEINGLIEASKTEPRIKGKLPVQLYNEIGNSLQFVLDRLLSTSLIVTSGFSKDTRHDIITPLNSQRKEVVTTLLMLFWIMAESINSKSPLPQHLPNALKARNRLVSGFQKLPALKNPNSEKNKEYVIFFAYIEAMKDLIMEVEKMVGLLKLLFGEKKLKTTERLYLDEDYYND